MLRAEAGFREAQALLAEGFVPDIIVGHMGWGDMLFLKDVWPSARMGVYCELFYDHSSFESDFDPEYPPQSNPMAAQVRLKMKSLPQRLFFDIADAAISPTKYQAETYPKPFRDRITIVHDGIDTDAIKPFANPSVTLGSGQRFTQETEIVTFVARNLEPYRGYHVFMRALPAILAQRPHAHVFIVGADGVGYGAAPREGSWRDLFLNEVRDQIDLTRVHFVGTLPHAVMHELIALSRAHVYLTYPFVLSWSLLEAMALGAPVVASDTAPVREVITHGVNGYLTEFLDHEALARRVCQTIDDPVASAELGRNARDTIVKDYDLKRLCLPKQLAWIDRLAQMQPRPPLFD